MISIRLKYCIRIAYLLSMPANMPCGAGETGESVYGEKADASPLDGEGIIGLLSAMVRRKV